MMDDLAARVLYRDANLIVLNKPAGLPVHAGPGGGGALEDGFAELRFGIAPLPRAAHRLDRDTSGCLVLGRHDKAIRRLGRLFSAGEVSKCYWAILRGVPAAETGRIEVPLLKQQSPTGWRIRVDAAGKPARTAYRVLGSAEGVAWVKFRPETGRTHQIRVHALQLGTPVFGDSLYDPQARGPLCLHARSVTLAYRPGSAPLTVTAPPPAHMLEWLKACGWRGDTSEGLTTIHHQRLASDPASGG